MRVLHMQALRHMIDPSSCTVRPWRSDEGRAGSYSHFGNACDGRLREAIRFGVWGCARTVSHDLEPLVFLFSSDGVRHVILLFSSEVADLSRNSRKLRIGLGSTTRNVQCSGDFTTCASSWLGEKTTMNLAIRERMR